MKIAKRKKSRKWYYQFRQTKAAIQWYVRELEDWATSKARNTIIKLKRSSNAGYKDQTDHWKDSW